MFNVNKNTGAIVAWKDYKIDPRYLLILFLLAFVIAGQVYLGFFQKWDTIFVSIASSLVSELLLGRIFRKRWMLSLSPLITGLGVSLLLSSFLLWPYALTSFLAILFKFVIRFKGGHVFNPNNLSMVIILFFFPDYAVSTPQQWTNGLGVMTVILLLGVIVVIYANRWDTVVAYLAGFTGFGLIRHYVLGAPLWAALGPLMGPSLQLFTFFMITDPKTTPNSRKARVIFSLLVALLDAYFRISRYPNPQFYALFLVCLCMVIPYRIMANRQKAKLETSVAQ